MDRYPNKLNIQQLAERSGYSADKIDLLIQEGVVSMPAEGFIFTAKHEQELQNIRTVAASGYPIECGRNGAYLIDSSALT